MVWRGSGTVETWAPETWAPLGAAAVGDTVTLPWPDRSAWTGQVTLRSETDGGVLIGARGEDATLDVTFGADGSLQGIVWFDGAAAAWRVSGSTTGGIQVEPVPTSALLCAAHGSRFPNGLGMMLAATDEAQTEKGPRPAAEESTDPLRVSSRPGSTRVIWLDFEGGTISGTSWNITHHDGQDFVAAPSQLSLEEKRAIWSIVVEDYSIFDVNVTTDPAVYAAAPATQRVRTIITPTASWFTDSIVLGVAYIGTFGTASTNPGWVFESQIGSCLQVGTVISHEAGHAFGLEHHGTTTSEYYAGNSLWVPIMGAGNKPIAQWSRGDYSSASRPNQHDIESISEAGLPLLPDDRGDTPAAAAQPTAVAHSTDGLRWEIAGVIHGESDRDAFLLDVPAAGTLSWDVGPPYWGPNAVLASELQDATGAVIAGGSTVSFPTAQRTVVAAGRYFLVLRGAGRGNPANTGYSAYGSTGHYRGHVVLNGPDIARLIVEPDHIDATINSEHAALGVRLRKYGVYNPPLRVTNSRPDLFPTQVPDETTLGGGYSVYDVRPYLARLPLGLTEGTLAVGSIDSPEPISVPFRVEVAGALLPITLAESPAPFDPVLTERDVTPYLAWTFARAAPIEGAWQAFYVESSHPLLLHPGMNPGSAMMSFSSETGRIATRINPDLPVGVYEETITIWARPGTPGFPMQYPVSLSVPEPVLLVNANNLEGWNAYSGQMSNRGISIGSSGSLVSLELALSTTSEWLGISAPQVSSDGRFSVFPRGHLPAGTYVADLTLTPINDPPVATAPVTISVSIIIHEANALSTSPAQPDWFVTPFNRGELPMAISRSEGPGPAVLYNLESTIPGLQITPSTISLGSSSNAYIVLKAPSVAPYSQQSGALLLRSSDGTIAHQVPLRVRQGPPVGQSLDPMFAGSLSEVTSPQLPGRLGAAIEVRLHGLRASDAGTIRAMLKPPDGLPITLLSGAAGSTVWDGQTLVFRPDGLVLPSTAVSLPSEAVVGPSHYLPLPASAPLVPAHWPSPPYGRPLEDVLARVQDGVWELWLDGTPLSGGPLLSGGWEVVLRQDMPVARPALRWHPADISVGQVVEASPFVVQGGSNGVTVSGNTSFAQSGNAHWQQFLNPTSLRTSGLRVTWRGDRLDPGHHVGELWVTGRDAPFVRQTIQVDLRTWPSGQWGASWIGPAWEVSGTQPVVTSDLNLTGVAETPTGVEVILAGLETSDLSTLGLTLIGPDGHRVELLPAAPGTGPFIGNLRLRDDQVLEPLPGSTSATLTLAPRPGSSTGATRGARLAAWAGWRPVGLWQLEARWPAGQPGGARLREAWGLRLHALEANVGLMPNRLWIETLPGGSGRSVVRFRPQSAGFILPIPADDFLTVEALGGGLFAVHATAPDSDTGNYLSSVAWQVPGDPASPYLLPVTVRVTPEAVPVLRGAGRTIPDVGTTLGGPSEIEVRGHRGPLKSVRLHLHGLDADMADFLSAMLEAPDGRGYVVFHSLRYHSNFGPPIGRLTFAGASAHGQITVSAQDSVKNPHTAIDFPIPGTESLVPYQSGFLSMAGRRANGIWRLHLNDRRHGGRDFSLGGWDLTLETDPGYELWQAEHSVGEPGADDDGDGRSNLAEWYFGTSPNVVEPSPTAAEPAVSVAREAGVDHVQLTYRRRALAGAVVDSTVERWNQDLRRWTTAPVLQRTTTPADPGFETVTLTIAPESAPHQLVRLRLQL